MSLIYDLVRFRAGRLLIISVGMLSIVALSGCMQELSIPGAAASRTPIATVEVTASPVEPTQTAFPTALVELPTLAPTVEPTALPSPAPPVPTSTSLPTLVVPTPVPLSNEARWRAQQLDREVFPAIQTYTTTGSELWWYDPIQQQHVVLGSFRGDFLAQADFIVLGIGVEALEVPYQVNKSYGLTAISPALLARIQTAGYVEWIETYVLRSSNITSP
jgi:hypothetical protein